MLETKIANNSSDVVLWAERRWGKLPERLVTEDLQPALTVTKTTTAAPRDWWMVKASKGNGGRDVWVLNEDNYARVLSELAPQDEYVIQR